MEVVNDIVQRRERWLSCVGGADHRFRARATKLGHGYFESWWRQTAAEFRSADSEADAYHGRCLQRPL